MEDALPLIWNIVSALCGSAAGGFGVWLTLRNQQKLQVEEHEHQRRQHRREVLHKYYTDLAEHFELWRVAEYSVLNDIEQMHTAKTLPADDAAFLTLNLELRQRHQCGDRSAKFVGLCAIAQYAETCESLIAQILTLQKGTGSIPPATSEDIASITAARQYVAGLHVNLRELLAEAKRVHERTS